MTTPPRLASNADRTVGAGYLFGLPIGDLGGFATLLVSVAAGFCAFFASTFLGIVGLLIFDMATQHVPDFAISYRLIGLPIGLLVLITTFFYLGFLWIKRKFRHA